jgi:hypothetical protein
LGSWKLASHPQVLLQIVNSIYSSRRKEAADEKIKEMLRMFVTAPQTKVVYFGGGHDSGYAGLVNESSFILS